jgi:hypothetical protein
MLALPKSDPYDEIYRDMSSWYRLIDPTLLDPGKKYSGYLSQSQMKGIPLHTSPHPVPYRPE